jgi:hypothetical protein
LKLLRYGPVGKEKPGLLDDQGRIRGLSAVFPDFVAESLAPAQLELLSKVSIDSLPIEPARSRDWERRIGAWANSLPSDSISAIMPPSRVYRFLPSPSSS